MLQQVREILDGHVTAGELRGMLKLRQAERHAQIAADTARDLLTTLDDTF